VAEQRLLAGDQRLLRLLALDRHVVHVSHQGTTCGPPVGDGCCCAAMALSEAISSGMVMTGGAAPPAIALMAVGPSSAPACSRAIGPLVCVPSTVPASGRDGIDPPSGAFRLV